MSPAGRNTIRVLIVEDEPKIAAAHRSYVDRLPGFQVVGVVHTGRDAISIAKRSQSSGVPVDLVLMDIGLPDMSGLAVAAALAGLRPRPDVIAVTSARDLAMVRAAVSHGVVLYLLKPFTFAAFREKLERYLEYRAALPAGETAVSQQDIDRAFGVLRTPDQRTTLPKGIAPQTMDEVSRAVRAAAEGLSAGEVGRAVGVSRVTAWRYLERMAEDGVVERRTDYGRTGRPQVRYVWLR
ncbi:response regulator [Nocardia seriolae]|uniref:Transcriptional regulatory protein n=1 Tax=Nocardia seriolae TaxID=37332 RepID=A0ABC9YXS7_9NOCA|nr:response regulator [Nocardia seriolae]APA96145.1 Transcriptional regulatory protein DcuR [Nocardia seriolae]WKY53803.1 response regulator [Nocardia seriolae]WNJ60542.1 response regulator [Nocardia seriolae]BEK85636.1 response regulator [Nocardia seriolae]BEK98537.1 response regulator [Nocardia seriolae]